MANFSTHLRSDGGRSGHLHRRRCSSADGFLENFSSRHHVGTESETLPDGVLAAMTPVDHVTNSQLLHRSHHQYDTPIDKAFEFQTSIALDPIPTPILHTACTSGPLLKPSPPRPNSYVQRLSPTRPTPYHVSAHKSLPSTNTLTFSSHPNCSPSSSPKVNIPPPASPLQPMNDDSIFLLNSHNPPPSPNFAGINLSFQDLAGFPLSYPKTSFLQSPTSDPATPLSLSSQETFVDDTQDRQKEFPSEIHPLPLDMTPNDSTPIKARPIQALTPNGTVRILPHTPLPPSTNSRRRSLRMLNSEGASDTAARIENAAKVKSLEAKPAKKRHVNGEPPLGSTHVPVMDITDEELALLSTATGYVLDDDAVRKISGGRTWDVGSSFA